MSTMTKNEARQRRKIRIRKKISGTAERPRLVIFRSNLHMYAQVVDDLTGATLAATSTLVLSKGGEKVSCNKVGAEAVGKEIARLAKEKSIEKVVFDRNGYLYHGRSRPWPMAPAKAASSSNPERIALSWNRMNWVSSRRSSP